MEPPPYVRPTSLVFLRSARLRAARGQRCCYERPRGLRLWLRVPDTIGISARARDNHLYATSSNPLLACAQRSSDSASHAIHARTARSRRNDCMIPRACVPVPRWRAVSSSPSTQSSALLYTLCWTAPGVQPRAAGSKHARSAGPREWLYLSTPGFKKPQRAKCRRPQPRAGAPCRAAPRQRGRSCRPRVAAGTRDTASRAAARRGPTPRGPRYRPPVCPASARTGY